MDEVVTGASGGPLYRGRLAPTPSGYLHAGHGQTFRIAWERARERGGKVVLRNDDLDAQRCRPEYQEAMFEDLRRFGLDWDEGPDREGPRGPYAQSARRPLYQKYWDQLCRERKIYPSPHSRKDVRAALSAPHEEGGQSGEALFPASLRPAPDWEYPAEGEAINWRFRVPDGETISFVDGRMGACSFTAGEDFGDFLVWRKDGFPSYEFATVVDDHLMGITEVVRGEDLLLSTARQILLYRVLDWPVPDFYHCPLVRDAAGQRLAKRQGSPRAD